MPVMMSLTNARKFYWTCDCGKSMGQWTKREKAQEDFERHGRVCSLNADRDD